MLASFPINVLQKQKRDKFSHIVIKFHKFFEGNMNLARRDTFFTLIFLLKDFFIVNYI